MVAKLDFVSTNQKRDWTLHKAECKSLVTIQPHSPSDTMRLVVRVLQRRKMKLKKKKKSKSELEDPSLASDFITGQEIDYLCSSKLSLIYVVHRMKDMLSL